MALRINFRATIEDDRAPFERPVEYALGAVISDESIADGQVQVVLTMIERACDGLNRSVELGVLRKMQEQLAPVTLGEQAVGTEVRPPDDWAQYIRPMVQEQFNRYYGIGRVDDAHVTTAPTWVGRWDTVFGHCWGIGEKAEKKDDYPEEE